jgi:hypothetical protein
MIYRCSVFLYLPRHCQGGIHCFLSITLFRHTRTLRADFRRRLTELANYTHFYLGIEYYKTFEQDLGQP